MITSWCCLGPWSAWGLIHSPETWRVWPQGQDGKLDLGLSQQLGKSETEIGWCNLRLLSLGRRMDIKHSSCTEFPHLGRKCRCPGYTTQVETLDLPQARLSSRQLEQEENIHYPPLLFLWASPASLSPLSWDSKSFDTDCFADFGNTVDIRNPGGGMGERNTET